MSTSVDKATLIQHIQDMLNNEQKGTLYITTENNHSLVVAFEKGAITGIYSRGVLRGAKAIECLAQVERASYTVNSNVLDLPGGMPDPEDILRIIGIQSKAIVGEPRQGIQGVGTNYHILALKIMEEQLRDAIGPYAVLVMNDLYKSMPPGYQLENLEQAKAVVLNLAKEIDSQKYAQEFIKTTINTLEHLYRSVI